MQQSKRTQTHQESHNNNQHIPNSSSNKRDKYNSETWRELQRIPAYSRCSPLISGVQPNPTQIQRLVNAQRENCTATRRMIHHPPPCASCKSNPETPHTVKHTQNTRTYSNRQREVYRKIARARRNDLLLHAAILGCLFLVRDESPYATTWTALHEVELVAHDEVVHRHISDARGLALEDQGDGRNSVDRGEGPRIHRERDPVTRGEE